MPKNKFIDKKNSVTFHLVHRSQQDPLAADEKAPQHVLLPVVGKQPDKKKRLEEQQKFGVFFDDDYNYLQHLRKTDKSVEWVETEKPKESTSKLKLPSSVFASKVEEDVGLLNKAAPQSGLRLDLDMDIVAAMDEDFDFDDPNNALEDNFLELANQECSDDEDDYGSVDSNFADEEMDEVGSLNGDEKFGFDDEETRSRFTEYSMTSSVIRRNEHLSLLDERFEKMYKAYDEIEVGALDCDEIEGHIPESSDLLLQYAKEFEKQQKREQLDKNDMSALHKRLQQIDDDADEDELVNIEVKPKEKWDCESILSTYSNIYNHPKLISEPKNIIKINSRTGMPINVLDRNKLTSKALNRLNDEYKGFDGKGTKSIGGESILSSISTLSIRPKGESPEDRRERKKQLKVYRKERRVEKKANAEAFKEEAKRQIKIDINNRKNVQGNRIL